VSGFSISNNLMANEVNFELSEHQQALGTSVRDLSSGLRVNTAADDPSGNAIAASLQTHAQAFSQASQNVTNAQNAGAVADGALAAVTDILLRIRELAVGAASTIDSSSDRVNIQAEISQLLLEINRIAQNTNFNGRALLDGSISGYQPAQKAQALITSNSILMSGASASNAPANLLLVSTTPFTQDTQPALAFGIAQNIIGSTSPQTVAVDSTAYLAPGQVYGVGGNIVTIAAVDPANDTITAVFTKNVTQGTQATDIADSSIVGAIAVGTQTVTMASPQPLYSGEILQIASGTFATNDVVVVQQVLSSTTFVATFNKAQPPGAGLYATNDISYAVNNRVPKNWSFSFGGSPTDGAPVGSTAYVVQTSGTGVNTVTKVVATGIVDGGSVSSTSVAFPATIAPAPGSSLTVYESVGLGAVPLVTQQDGTIKLTVVNASGTIGVQESFYDTATQTTYTSPVLMTPDEKAMLFDGVVTQLGDFGAADVGSTAYIKVLQSVSAITATNNPAFTVQSGADEGDVIQIGIPAVNTNTLRVSSVTVIGASGTDPTLASEDAIGQCDYALGQVTTLRAQIGAEIVRLGVDETNDDTAATALTASQSDITDLNVGPATTDFTEQQIDIDVATSILTQVNNLSDDILRLFQPPSQP
jgi:flagellin